MLLVISQFLINCGSTASIYKADGTMTEGEIIGGDNENLYVKIWGKDSSIPKSDIFNIDHPGNGLAVGGGILAAYGALNIAVGLPRCKDKGTGFCVGVFTPAVVGIPMLINGLLIWGKSTGNINKEKVAYFNDFQLNPYYSYREENSIYGLMLTKRF